MARSGPTGGLGPGDTLHHAITRTLSQNAACLPYLPRDPLAKRGVGVRCQSVAESWDSGPKILEPDRAGSRCRCRSVPLPAAACKAGDVSTRYFLPFDPFANVGVAGSSPVSCSRNS